MFENAPQQKKQGLPDDIFAGVDGEVGSTSRPQAQPPSVPMPDTAPPVRSPAAPSPTAPQSVLPSELPPAPTNHGLGAGKILAIIFITLGVLFVSAYFAYRLMVQPSVDGSVVDAVSDELQDDASADGKGREEEADDDDGDSQMDDAEGADEGGSEATDASTAPRPASLLDSDGDGLTNARELEEGTSITKSDTDGDGLGDREEVDVYQTDPKNPDTDGDTYLDGAEVTSGYDPNGPGRLFTVPVEESGS